MARPRITRSLSLSDFTSWYWLKTELVALCRTFGLNTTGSKLELEDRILGFLSGRPLKGATRRKNMGEMPSVFTPQTVIGKGWRCNPALGAYFRTILGSGFHFNATTRDFIHNGAGRTLADAATCYQASVHPTVQKPPIAKQLLYNQHFRDFFAAHPGATRQQAIDEWWEKRSRRNGTRTGAE